ncbi:MAG: NADH-quinone oxidoreductase subunit L [Gemmatales bacterium]|nr:NADH-quinone oxidoreductase subunit L [Gemmatales bacterium]
MTIRSVLNNLPGAEALCWGLPLALLVGTILAGIAAFHSDVRVRRWAHWPVLLAIAVALSLSLVLAWELTQRTGPVLVVQGYTFLGVSDFQVRWGLYIDSLAAVMLMLVNGIGLLVAIYSVGYMEEDEGYGRYFAVLGLFLFSMSLLVLVDNYFLVYVFWEGVGLCSYLLIGHWYERPAASQAARKAFVVNRIGDTAFFLGLVLLWYHLGSLRYGSVFYLVGQIAPEWITIICLLLFGGACAKSAQFPLHIWLPDAMEGPTPVSALIHAATMVTAGVYLIARSSLMFALSSLASGAVLITGTITALLGAIVAVTQYDLKRVLAYSTISQLGIMFMGLGVLSLAPELAASAAAAVLFHLVSHGLFKALLFLTAGNIMHSTGGLIDMRMLGGLRNQLPYTHVGFVIGGLALAAIPPCAGFYSKDAVLALFPQISGPEKRMIASVFGALFIFIGALTAFYISRAYLLTFWGEARSQAEGHASPHESPWVMLIPVMILALGSVLAGIILEPTGYFRAYIHLSEPFGKPMVSESEHGEGMWIISSVLLAMAGIGIAFWLYAVPRHPIGEVPTRWGILYTLGANKFFIEEIYQLMAVRPIEMLAWLAGWLDRIIDGLVDFVGWLIWWIGRGLRPMQNGQVQFYALAIILALAIFSLVLISRWGG